MNPIVLLFMFLGAVAAIPFARWLAGRERLAHDDAIGHAKDARANPQGLVLPRVRRRAPLPAEVERLRRAVRVSAFHLPPPERDTDPSEPPALAAELEKLVATLAERSEDCRRLRLTVDGLRASLALAQRRVDRSPCWGCRVPLGEARGEAPVVVQADDGRLFCANCFDKNADAVPLRMDTAPPEPRKGILPPALGAEVEA